VIGEMLESGAVFSSCMKFRYSLERKWNAGSRFVMFCGLNPSTADEITNDPTVRRCIVYAQDWGYDGLLMANAFAFRGTDPRSMLHAEDPVGPENNRWLIAMASRAALVVCAWGVHGAHRNRSDEVHYMLQHIKPLYSLGLTKDGYPRHPLYLRRDIQPQLWEKS
jgi:hypothetical protein